ncbi:lysoplasmalogenase [Oleiagrimonas soli]|uniref:Putative membrane protein YhhN n=1 Tax=Oleiagrimonas soli TaxID=1543381 RepID=A0A841KM88_9GAMM|nr:lysoplasmalogenase [Oleiagrimonas soli]MBB6184949.1 putative membrane protein YhhN [Oleiagrimonas soli]
MKGWRLVIAPVAAAAIAGALLGERGLLLYQAAKPLATLLILIGAWSALSPLSSCYRTTIAVGLAWCLLGDICLLPPWNAFLPGLGCFLMAHLAFLLAFAQGMERPAWWPAMLGCLALGAAVAVALWPDIPSTLRVPVAFYICVISLMAGQAFGRAYRSHGQGAAARAAKFAAAGAALFLLSDTLLACNRFHAPLPLASLWILGTYYAAIACIAHSVRVPTMAADARTAKA